ncbi:ATP-dependent DNA helicase [Trichonephila clavipes]|nr:ATP-dependent DNA helicase [Trichonephila clavipes]
MTMHENVKKETTWVLKRPIHIYPTRAQVDAHNTAVLDRYRAKEVRLFKIQSQDVLINATSNVENLNMDNIVSGSSLFAKGQVYVALRRVRSLDGLRIAELDCSKLTGKAPCNENAMKKMEHMRQLRPQAS